MDDWRLLREYLDHGSETAFAELVKRHVNLVYSVALRRLGNAAVAEEVTQSVFCLLARKARQLGPGTALVSWLYQTTSFTALKYLRTEGRRRHREQQALLMNSTDTEDSDAAWQQLAPLLDDAMKELAEPDRFAILMRFFEGKPLRAVGEVLGIGEDAARMRVNRALEKLRAYLGQRGAACSSALLGTVLAERAVQAAPVSAAQSIEAAAITAAKAAAIPSLFLIIAMFMANAKFKILGLIGVGLLLASAVYLSNRGRDRAIDLNRGPVQTGQIEASPRRLAKETAFAPSPPAVPATPLTIPTPTPLDELRKTLFSPVFDAMWPSPDLIRALQALGPNNPHLAVPLLIEGLQSQDTNVHRRAAHALAYLATSSKKGRWAKAAMISEGSESQSINAEPLRNALLDAMPALRNTIRSSNDLISQTIAINAATTIHPHPDLLPDIVEGMKAARGQRVAVANSARDAFVAHPDAARALLQPLLSDMDEEMRISAACSCAALPGVKDPVALEILCGALGKHFSDLQILPAIAAYGAEAKPYLSALMQRSETLFQLPSDSNYVWELKDQYCSTLAAIDPDLRHKVPELDQWFQEKEQLAGIKTRMADPSASISELTEALSYLETRYDALKRLAELGPAAAEALPALRQALKDAWKYNETLNTVGNVIKRIDPDSPAPFHGRQELMPAVNAVMQQAERLDATSRDALTGALNENSWGAMYTPADLASLADKIGQVDPQLRASFVSKLLEIDPKLDKVLQVRR